MWEVCVDKGKKLSKSGVGQLFRTKAEYQVIIYVYVLALI